jgi:hypothetical protein
VDTDDLLYAELLRLADRLERRSRELRQIAALLLVGLILVCGLVAVPEVAGRAANGSGIGGWGQFGTISALGAGVLLALAFIPVVDRRSIWGASLAAGDAESVDPAEARRAVAARLREEVSLANTQTQSARLLVFLAAVAVVVSGIAWLIAIGSG